MILMVTRVPFARTIPSMRFGWRIRITLDAGAVSLSGKPEGAVCGLILEERALEKARSRVCHSSFGASLRQSYLVDNKSWCLSGGSPPFACAAMCARQSGADAGSRVQASDFDDKKTLLPLLESVHATVSPSSPAVVGQSSPQQKRRLQSPSVPGAITERDYQPSLPLPPALVGLRTCGAEGQYVLEMPSLAGACCVASRCCSVSSSMS